MNLSRPYMQTFAANFLPALSLSLRAYYNRLKAFARGRRSGEMRWFAFG